MLIQNPGLVAGKRAFTIIVNAQSGVAFQIEPGDLVDVVATYPAPNSTNPGTRPGSRNRAEVVVPSAEVLTVGQPAAGTETGASVPVNLLLTPDQVLRVLFAESFAAKLSLSKVAPGSTPTTPPIYAPTQ
jgi:pilus assembly protein CpaB